VEVCEAGAMQNINALINSYIPLSSNPFEKTDYKIYKPCSILSPFIACYWGMDNPNSYMIIDDEVIVPHGCIELIIEANYTQNTTTFFLAGIHDTPFNSKRHINNDVISRISIRFFFWAYHLFVNTDMYGINTGVLNDNCFDGEWVKSLGEIILLPTIEQRIKHIERFLISKLSVQHINANLYNSVYRIVSSQGAVSINDLCSYTTISQRQLERLYLRYIGVPPKKISDIVRYQNLWKDILFSNTLDITDAADKYGFADQSHLLNNFRKYHGTYPIEAKQNALNVDFFQYNIVNP